MVNNRKLVIVTINFCDLVGARQGSAWDYFAEKGRHDAFNLPKKQLMECGFTVKLPRSWVLFPTILAYIWLFLVFQCLFYFHASSAFQGYCECHCRKEWGDRNEFPFFCVFSIFPTNLNCNGSKLLFTNGSDVQIFHRGTESTHSTGLHIESRRLFVLFVAFPRWAKSPTGNQL